MVYVTQVCWQLARRIRMELLFHPDPAGIHHCLCVQWKTPDDGQMFCPKHVDIFTLAWPCIIYKYFASFPNWYTFIFLYTFTIFYNFSLHVSDRLVHHQENQITLAASGTLPSFVVISCVAVGAPTTTHEITTNEGKVPDAASVISFSWWWTSRSETCREKL